MKIARIQSLCVLTALFFFSGNISATVINFDDITTGYTYSPSGDDFSYQGFTWDIEHIISTEQYQTSGECLNTIAFPSPDYAVSNYCGGGTMTVSSGSDFDFNGAYLSTWAHENNFYDNGARTMTITGYDDGTIVGTRTIDLTVDFTYVETNFLGIDRLDFDPNDGTRDNWFLMDNFTFNEPSSSVPEPSVLMLLGFSLLGLAGIRKTRKTTK